MVGGFAVSMINKFKNDEEYVYETVLGYVVDKVSIIFSVSSCCMVSFTSLSYYISCWFFF